VLASLAASDSVETILAAFPALKTEDVQAAIAFAAASAEEDLPVPATPHIVGIRRGLAQAKTGEGRSAGDVLDELEREA